MRGHLALVYVCTLVACGDNLQTPGVDPPDVEDFALTTDEDTPVTRAVTASGGARALTLTVTAPEHGTVVVDGLSLTYTPEQNYNGDDEFVVMVSDGVDSDGATIAVTVTPINDAPAAVADSFATDEDVALVVAQASVLANDTDVDGDTLTITALGTPAVGTATITGSDITFTPPANFVGTASFDYTISDGTATASASITITVGGANDAPIAVDDAATTDEDTAAVIVNLLANDTDPDGQTLSVTAVANATNGTVTLDGNDATFTPAANFNGSATFEYTVSDGMLTDVGLVTIGVTPVNDSPVAGDDTASVQADASIAIPHATLLANDTDADATPLTISAAGNAVNGTVTVEASTVTFTPTPGFVGTATFEYTATDGTASDVALVTVTVSANPVCGDGTIAGTEQCDDGDTDPDDGCSVTCQVEVGWACANEPSLCAPICGDSMTVGDEPCDDGDPDNTDGCTTECVVGAICDATAIPGGDRFNVDAETGHCYVSFDTEGTTFAGAQTACAGIGGYLATVTSATEDVAVRAVQNVAENPWIGAGEDTNDTDTVFDWVTDEPFGFTRFAPGEPDDDVGVGGLGDCLHLANASGEWADTNCTIDTFVDGRICEVEPEPCGDSIVQASAGEECDDSNTTPGDGCSATCQLEPFVVFSFTGSAGSEATFSADGTTPPGLAALPEMSRGAGVVASAGMNTFAANNWTTATTLDATEFFSFTVTPAASFSMTLTALELDERRSPTGIRTWAVRSSLDGFATDLQVFAVPDDDTTRANNNIVLPAAFATLTAPVEFRIYGYGAEAAGGSWRIDNVEIYGFTTGP